MGINTEIGNTIIRDPLDLADYSRRAQDELLHMGITHITSASPLAHAHITGGMQAALQNFASLLSGNSQNPMADFSAATAPSSGGRIVRG